MGASSGPSAGAWEGKEQERRGGLTGLRGRGTVWRVVLVGLAHSTGLLGQECLWRRLSTPGQPPTKLRKSLLLIPVPGGRGLSFQWKDTHSCHIRGKSMVSPGVAQN